MTQAMTRGDIWALRRPGDWVVVPTNIGWRRSGRAVMGKGLAAQAAILYPDLDRWYGPQCSKREADTPVLHYPPARLILFPTKPLLPSAPNRSWVQPASLELIQRGLPQLRRLMSSVDDKCAVDGDVYLPLLGCGAGDLTPSQVLPVLEPWLVALPRLHLVLPVLGRP